MTRDTRGRHLEELPGFCLPKGMYRHLYSKDRVNPYDCIEPFFTFLFFLLYFLGGYSTGISPILPMFLHGLIYGTPETREIAASGLGDIIALTSATALKPFVIQVCLSVISLFTRDVPNSHYLPALRFAIPVQITGPLIRVVADRFAWQV